MRGVVSLTLGMVALVLLNVAPSYAGEPTIPEPATATLVGTALAALGIRVYRNRKR